MYAVPAGRQAHLSAGPLTDRWIAQCVVGQRGWWGILFLSVCCCCYVIAGVLFPVSVRRHAASPAKRQELARGRAGETVPRYLQLSSIGVERASCRPDRDETKAPLDCSLQRPFYPFFFFFPFSSRGVRKCSRWSQYSVWRCCFLKVSGDAPVCRKMLLCAVVDVKEVLLFKSSARTLLWLVKENGRSCVITRKSLCQMMLTTDFACDNQIIDYIWLFI